MMEAVLTGSGSEVRVASSDRPRRDSVAIIRLWKSLLIK